MSELLKTPEFWYGTIIVLVFAVISGGIKSYLKKFLKRHYQNERENKNDPDHHEN